MTRWSKILIGAGSLGILVGSLDPMEGSLIILPGSGLVALGVYLGRSDPPVIRFWLAAFVLNAIGVGALWGLSAVGGFGGDSGRSMWWGVLILPYLFGWLMGLVRILATLIEMLKAKRSASRQGQTEAAPK